MSDLQVFIDRDHDLGLGTAGRVGYELWRETRKLGIDLSFKIVGPLAKISQENRELLAPYRLEFLMVWLAEQLMRQAEAWAKRCFERGAKKFSHDEERYYYALKGRAAGVLPAAVSVSDLQIGGQTWDPTLSSSFVPDGEYVMDVRAWPRNCARGCAQCAANAGQRNLIAVD